MDVIKSLNRTVARIGGVDISITVLVNVDDKTVPIRYYPKNDGSSVYMEFPAFITITLPTEYPQVTTVRRRIVLTTKSKHDFLDGFKKFLDVFQRDDIFYISNRRLCMYPVKEDMIQTMALGGKWFVELRPTIVDDGKGGIYEGGYIAFNQEANGVDLTYSELYEMYKVIDAIDIFMYSQLLLNFFGIGIFYPNSDEVKKRSDIISDRIESLDIDNKIDSRMKRMKGD